MKTINVKITLFENGDRVEVVLREGDEEDFSNGIVMIDQEWFQDSFQSGSIRVQLDDKKIVEVNSWECRLLEDEWEGE